MDLYGLKCGDFMRQFWRFYESNDSNRHTRYTPRAVQLIVQDAAQRAGLAQRVTPHRLRASVATLLLDAGMPIDQVQKFLRHKHLRTTQIYAETSKRRK